MVEISTSLLSVKKEEGAEVIYNLDLAHPEYYHIDIMDGKFVERDTTEIMNGFINEIMQVSNIPLDIHLMVKDVKKYIDEYVPVLPNIITFHYEAVKNKKKIMELINYIKQNNIKVGISIKPDTKVKEIYEYLPYIHMVLIMTVEPGKGGQALIPETIEKIKQLKEYIEKNNIDIDIEADGGINLETMERVKNAGVDIAVVGSGITKTQDYKETIKKLKSI